MERHPDDQSTAGSASAVRFLDDVQRSLQLASASDGSGIDLGLQAGLGRALMIFQDASVSGRKTIFVGNGGSAAIASHISVDMWKCADMEAIAFNDTSLLTCVGNDFGYEHLFAEPIRRFARTGDVVVAISSSGRSPNILNGVTAARSCGCPVVTLSGFAPDNPLRSQGDVNFYVPFCNYGLVEVSHLALLHSVLDAHMGYPRD